VTAAALAESAAALASIDALAARLRWDPPRWLLAGSLLLVGLAVVGGASSLKQRTASFDLDASISGFDLAAGSATTGRSQLSDVVDISDLQATGVTGPAPRFSSISSFELQPGTNVTVSQNEPGCIAFDVRNPNGLALRLVGVVAGRPGSMGTPDRLLVPDKGSVSFCTHEENRALVFLNPVSVDLSRLQSATPPEVRTSAIDAGQLRLADTQKTSPLSGLVRLRFADIKTGSLTLRLGPHLRLLMSAIVGSPQSLSGPTSEPEDLRPSILEVFTSSPIFRPLIAALAGVIGMLWTGYQFFFLRRS